jgi:hypothetical protein
MSHTTQQMEDILENFDNLKIDVRSHLKLNESIELLKPIFEKYLKDPSIEIEGRLGIYDEDKKKFSSNIGKENYNKIEHLLKSCSEWVDKGEINETDFSSKKLRLSQNENGTQRCIKKTRILVVDFVLENGPLDFRVAVNKEIPVDVELFPMREKSESVRKKNRKSFNYKMWNFDLTKVVTKKSSIEEHSYEFEIELNKEKNNIQDSKYLSESLILKLLDNIKICGDMNNTSISIVQPI